MHFPTQASGVSLPLLVKSVNTTRHDSKTTSRGRAQGSRAPHTEHRCPVGGSEEEERMQGPGTEGGKRTSTGGSGEPKQIKRVNGEETVKKEQQQKREETVGEEWSRVQWRGEEEEGKSPDPWDPWTRPLQGELGHRPAPASETRRLGDGRRNGEEQDGGWGERGAGGEGGVESLPQRRGGHP
eukprot:758513-Hanusia_phi.AAC.2